MTEYTEYDQQTERIHNHPLPELQYAVEKDWYTYAQKFRRLDSGSLSMNWCAGLFGCVWAAYRKMWKNAFILLGIELINTALVTVVKLLLGNTLPALILQFLFLIALIAICGLLGDKMYFNEVCNTLQTYQIKVSAGSTDASSYLTGRRGTSAGNAAGMLLLRGILVYVTRAIATYLTILILYASF